jgi:hypothetical protein
MKHFLIIALFCVPAQTFGQGMINKSKAFVKNKLETNTPGDSLRGIVSENDSTIQMTVPSQSSNQATFIYNFDQKGKCSSEKAISKNEVTHKKLLHEILDQKQYGWKRLNENQYVSKFSENMLIELPGEPGIFIITILRTNWDKKMYELLYN